MDVIYHNPFRVLGLPITATDREVAKSISDLSIFMHMGKLKEFDCDRFFPVKPHRTSESVDNASRQIEQPHNKVFYALFWFWENPANTVDQMAFEELRKGNFDKAIQFWRKATDVGLTPQNSSNHKNLAILYLGLACQNGVLDKDMFLKSMGLAGAFLADDPFEHFIQYVAGSTHSIDPSEILGLYVDEIISLAKPYLDKDNAVKTRELIQSFSSFPETIQNGLLRKFIGKHIHNIERQIEISISRRNKAARDANKAGFELLEKTQEDLKHLNTILSESDLEYQLIADKLANEIIECSISYFNEFCETETDPGDDALKLLEYAQAIAISGKIKERIDKNMPVLMEYVNEKPKRERLKPVHEQVTYIHKRIGNLNTGTVNAGEAKTFVVECKAQLDAIRDRLGKEDGDYRELCDLVAGVAIGMCVQYLNTEATAARFLSEYSKRMYLAGSLSKVRPALEAIGQLDMSRSPRSKYEDLCTKLGITPTSAGGCYIATMVYGSYNAPEVLVLRKFRDERMNKSWIGRKFIDTYYRYSPSLVRKTNNLRMMHVIFKAILDPLVSYLRTKDE